MQPAEKVGVLLANTGSTAAPRAAETRVYLRQFLSDPRILDVPAPLRWFLVNCVILPFRPKQSAEAYAKIWTDSGSPLIVNSHNLQAKLQNELPSAAIELGMAYGAPSIADGLRALISRGAPRIIVVPLFPQYASATTGSILEYVYRFAAKGWNVPAISVVPPFHSDAGFLDAWAAVARPALQSFEPEFVLFSFHGLPERQIRKSDPTGRRCLVKSDCCANVGTENQYCYRAHCFATTRGLAARLDLDEKKYVISFQSRLGRDAWLQPATDATLRALAQRGVRRLAVLCPAFVSDCLETLEEIGIRGRETFLGAGGKEFALLPCLNSHPAWVSALAEMIRRA